MYSKTLSIAKSLIAHLEKKKGTRIARPFFYTLSAQRHGTDPSGEFQQIYERRNSHL
jgi:hypothetical protein